MLCGAYNFLPKINDSATFLFLYRAGNGISPEHRREVNQIHYRPKIKRPGEIFYLKILASFVWCVAATLISEKINIFNLVH